MPRWRITRGPAPVADEFFVDPNSILDTDASPWLLSAARLAARHPGGFTVGALLAGLGDPPLERLAQAFARFQFHGPTRRELLLLALMLANGEGLPVRSAEQLGTLARRLSLFCHAERQRRAGQVRFDPMQLSLEAMAIRGLRVSPTPPAGSPADRAPPSAG
jgi:hypothetical protein